MYIPPDPPLVLHMPTSWQPESPPVLSPHTVAEVRLPGIELVLICESDALPTELNRDRSFCYI